MAKLLTLLALLAFVALGSAQTCSNNGTLTVSGQGSSTGTPDIATVSLDVTSTKKTAQEAREDAAQAATNIIAAVSDINGISADDITTVSVSLSPQYGYPEYPEYPVASAGSSESYPPPPGPMNITGYTFTQSMQIKVNNLTNELLGTVIDTAVQAGGDNVRINYIQAELSPALKLEKLNEARIAAVKDAQSAADVLAQAAGVTKGAIKSFSEAAPYVPLPYVNVPMADAGAAAAPQATPTPVNVGTADVTTTVTIEYAICSP